ncbi:D-alanyl-D-alanine carboxypeptidase family protein [Candidatus Nomurabacteria bacterium]|nr:D-alanyl-D-alanine carboxypeptidase family protein [Candidatus Kaiserbacteria bacterium]MCB9810358.1 D-alanyl-D-alanine carboxypeptidase family protein [Candidatus Nomurabacteria bacterium]MCB9818060.1 D-alanyl-D-alanine carboxypeptidase family protein [Candidatus Nomurabacteria bacterium]
MKIRSDATLYSIGAVAIIGIISASYLAVKLQGKDLLIETLLQERNALLKEVNNSNAKLTLASTTIEELQTELDDLHEDLEDLADDYKDEKNRNEDFEDQIRALSGTLGDLDKLAKTDKELLAKYSKVYFLNENYTPTKLKEIDNRYILEGKKDQYFHASAIEHLEDMLKAASRDKIDLKVVSGYRSFDEQTDLKGQYTQVYGSGANTFSADQGYSEHQLGTTVDLSTPEVGGAYDSFANTEAYKWLQKNAYKYGFILSYPEGNSFYIFEPWHWRFVGTDLARDLDRSNDSFYDLDQRELDEYLLNFFD